MPDRQPRQRRGRIKARQTAHLYQVDFGRGSEWAYYPGDDLLTLGQDRTAIFNPVTEQWELAAMGGGSFYDTYVHWAYDDWDPAAATFHGYVRAGDGSEVSWATLRGLATGNDAGWGNLGASVGLIAGSTTNTWVYLTRGLASWNLGVMPVGSVIKSATLTAWNAGAFSTGLAGGQVGWVQTNKPAVNAPNPELTDFNISGDTLTPLLTDLLDIDEQQTLNPPFGVDYDWETMPSVTWNMTAEGVAYLQDVFDNPPIPTYRKAMLRMLLEWDRLNTPPTWVSGGFSQFGSGGPGYYSDDGMLAQSTRLRLFV